ncbi:MAG: NAD(P)/FAD-dependent oxidoreductase [Burkholderiaceae bacterium]|nr:NAD(P)/FAD-dependent oxidoreductase [Burkholderiaceae bacterium]
MPDRTAFQAPANAAITTDALVIGAGPTGLFQVFQLGLLEIGCHVVDSLPVPGGQCIELYPDKPIYDIPAVPVCTGRELVDRLLTQVAPMAPSFHLSQQVSTVEPQADGRFEVTTTAGTRFLARSIFIAGGVGSFVPRHLKVDGIDRFFGRQVFHTGDAIPATTGRQVVVLGEDDAALEYALSIADSQAGRPTSVTLMHRRDAFTAAPATVDRMRAACDAGRMRFVAAQAIGLVVDGDRLTNLSVACADGSTVSLPVDLLIVLWGLSPKLGPIADWGVQLERKQVVVDTETFETSVPRIFAVGDVNTYPGKKRLIVCGFHEATMAAYGAATYLRPDRPTQVQYTTTSTRLHRLLGVVPHG